ncbi:MAG TPA: HupE/UreJ family protein [Pirellulales bacterium]|nr:HupE/UreJ family protein [Pirellulales bacterium]
MSRIRLVAALAGAICLSLPAVVSAHPLTENAADVVVGPDRITIDARISSEEIVLVESEVGRTSTDAEWQAAVERHAKYVERHFHVRVDGREVPGTAEFAAKPIGGDSASDSSDDPAQQPMVPYRWTCSLPTAPKSVEIGQDFLREFPRWHATVSLRTRRVDQSDFELSLLQRGQTARIACEWSPGAAPVSAASVRTDVDVFATFRAYAAHGIEHILTGYDHLLFITALVLAAGSLWDLIKVVSAFTLAHTLTLTLSVFNIVALRSSIVEPMIAASIVFVAVQNMFWPERSSGWARLAIAFSFGLFHGLGFAGGLKDALVGMPNIALWLALIAFSLGVEIGHQLVVIPMYSLLWGVRNARTLEPRTVLQTRILKFGSAGITLAGIYFLVVAICGIQTY